VKRRCYVTCAGPAASIRVLHTAIQTLKRQDVIDALLTLTPLYRYDSSDNNNDPYREMVLQGHQGQGHQGQGHQGQGRKRQVSTSRV